MNAAHGNRLVLRLGLLAVVSVYFLILVGGTVRATGAGLGCPDWPMCFGQLIPPTHESQLPVNWREIYADRGYDTMPFDPLKTWIEYTNRLVGVTIGLLIIAFVGASARLRKADPVAFRVALLALIAVAFNGWLGSKVVSSNLKPVMISLHMAGAFVVQMALIYATTRTMRKNFSADIGVVLPNWLRYWLLLTMAALVVQIVMGLQIRESVDWISRSGNDATRQQWIELVPQIFYVHRSFSWLVLLLAGVSAVKIFKSALRYTVIGKASMALVGLVCFEMMLGGALNHLGFPAVAQPVHLLTAHLIFGVLWFQWCLLSVARNSHAVFVSQDGSSVPVAGTVSSSSVSDSSSNRNSYV